MQVAMTVPTRPRAVVVEDAPEFQRLAQRLLEREGYDVQLAASGEEGLDLARREDPELVLIDLLLPGMDGFEVCRRLREFSDAYAVMVTARDDQTDKVVGLRVGADDYVTKPYSPAELSARIAALRRRPRMRAGAPQPTHCLVDGPLEVDLEAREVRVSGVPVGLTRTEFDLLQALVTAPRRVLTRAHLVEVVWGPGGADPHVVDVHVGNLRRKIRAVDPSPERFVTVRGVGYRFQPGAA